MTLGLAVTALTAGWVVSDLQRLLRISGEPWLVWGLFILQMIIVAVLSAAVTRLSAALAAVLFLLYAALTGVTLSLIFLMYTQENVTSVFWIAAGTFLLSGGVGLVLKRDLSGAGGLLTMLLLGWVLTFHFGLGHRGLALSTGCVASLNFIVLYVVMQRHLGSMESAALAGMLARMLGPALLLAGVCLAGKHWLLADWAVQPFSHKLAMLALTIAIAGGAFAVAALLFRVRELDSIAAAIKRRLKR